MCRLDTNISPKCGFGDDDFRTLININQISFILQKCSKLSLTEVFHLAHYLLWFFLTDNRAVFFQTFQHVLVGHSVRHARQRQDYGARARVHQQQRHVTDSERRRVQHPFQALGVGERHVTSFARQANRSQFVLEFGILHSIDHFVHLFIVYVEYIV